MSSISDDSMFHVKHLLLCLAICLCQGMVKGQGTLVLERRDFVVSRSRDAGIEQSLAGYAALQKLDSLERDSYYWINLLRKDPPAFSHNYLTPFTEQFSGLDPTYVRSLKKTLAGTGELPMLVPAPVVQAEAERHARDLAKHIGRLSHSSSDGRSFSERMAQAGIRKCGGENVFEGEDDALVALLLLLIDAGVPSLGHRNALLNPGFNIMGVAAEPSKDGKIYLVQLFSCQ